MMLRFGLALMLAAGFAMAQEGSRGITRTPSTQVPAGGPEAREPMPPGVGGPFGPIIKFTPQDRANLLKAEEERHRQRLVQIQSQEIGIHGDYQGAMVACGRDLACKREVHQRYDEQMRLMQVVRIDENTTYRRNLLQIRQG